MTPPLRALLALTALAACGGNEAPAPDASAVAALPLEEATILFTRTVDGNADVFLRTSDGALHRITDDPAQDHWAGWSPQAGRLVFQTLRDGDREVYVAGPDGSDPTNLTRHPADDLLPAWSPDGSRILFFSTRGEERGPSGEYVGNLWVMEADGSAPRRLTATPLSSSFAGSWAPDGRSIVFTRDVGALALHVLDVATGRESRLADAPEGLMGGRYSPDGTRIAATLQVGEESRIVVLDANGVLGRTLTSGGAHYYPTWSPDGAWIVFTGTDVGGDDIDILAVPAEGGEVRALVSTPADERFGTWIPAPGPASR